MNLRHPRFIRPTLGTACVAAVAALAGCNGDACFGVDVCFNNTNTQTIALSGTAATGAALLSSIQGAADHKLALYRINPGRQVRGCA